MSVNRPIVQLQEVTRRNMDVNIGIRQEILILGHSKCEIWNLDIKIFYISR